MVLAGALRSCSGSSGATHLVTTVTRAPLLPPDLPASYNAQACVARRKLHTERVSARKSTPLFLAWGHGSKSQEWKDFRAGVRLIMDRMGAWRKDGSYIFPLRCFDCGIWTGADRLGRKVRLHKRGDRLHVCHDELHFICRCYEAAPPGGVQGDACLPLPVGAGTPAPALAVPAE